MNKIGKISYAILLAWFVFIIIVGCTSSEVELLVGAITGPATVDENTSADYNVTASGDTGISYLWALDPTSAGALSNSTSETCIFMAGEADGDVDATLTVSVDSDNAGPVVRSLDFTVEDLTIPDTGWVQTWGSTTSDRIRSVAIDPTGDIYVTGEFTGTVDFDPGSGVTEFTSNGEEDVFLVKFDSDGALLSSYAWGSGRRDQSYCVETDDSGNVYISGVFYGTVDFDPTAGVDEHSADDATFPDYFLTSLASDGTYRWTLTWSGLCSTGIPEGIGLCVDDSDSVFVSGSFCGTTDLDPTDGIDNHVASGFYDAFLIRLDTSGSFYWAESWGGPVDDIGMAVDCDNDGNLYVAGYDGYGHAFLRKMTSTGALEWSTGWLYSSCNDVAIDSSANVYVTGDFIGPTDFDPGSGDDIRTSEGLYDVFLCMLDTDGNYQWAVTFGGVDGDNCKGVALDSSGNPFITGLFMSTVDFDPGPDPDNRTSDGIGDAFLSSFDSSGNLLWARTWGATLDDIGYSVAVAPTGEIFAAGAYSGTVDFDPGIGMDAHSSNGEYDCFLIRFFPDGFW